ncbi:MAG: zinc-ribbon domain-containing protein [Proteobacteria bacterium]|nr:zinc-ribbon domain-containing protein [Pseudomonadota bacterium]MBS0572791.1 zinc-ribbon domain-containing protein [Pseudomonadota bacterium]
MRLTCPNCDAQYEVDAAVIPDEGRDVQCSSCGHTWFQAAAAEAVARPAPTDDGYEDLPDLDDLPAASPEAAPVAAETPPAALPDAPAGLKPRGLDEAVRTVLREEAERESEARRAEGSSVEAQGEFGRSEAASAPAPDPGPEAAVAEPAAVHDEGHLVSRASRRELLPDIEEINSTLRATSERSGDPAARNVPETLRQRRSGFRRGFLSALTVMILALLPYVLAEPLARRVPTLAPAVTGYAHAIDSVRMWLDGRMKSTTDSLRSNGTTP